MSDNDEKFDPVSAPKGYTLRKVPPPGECIDVIEAWELPHHLACAVKYISRFRDKNGVEDLKKARWYLDRYIIKYGG